MRRSVESSILLVCCTQVLVAGPVQTLVSTGDTWKYNDQGVDLGASWSSVGFDDSGWSSGGSELGFGDGDETTTITQVNGETAIITAYFRKEVTIGGLQESSVFRFQVKRDDGVVIYLNGDEIHRDNMPDGAVAYGTFANGAIFGDAEQDILTFDLPGSSFLEGSNTLAVEVHQATIGSSDLSFDMNLGEVVDSRPPFTSIVTDPAGLDADGNGLSDLWEALFGAEGISPDGDSDGDGVSNKDESSFGTDPFDPNDKLKVRLERQDGAQFQVCWDVIEGRPGQLEFSPDLGTVEDWEDENSTPSVSGDEYQVSVSGTPDRMFYRLRRNDTDTDLDQVPDWVEAILGSDSSGSGSANSTGQGISYDTNDDGSPDVTISGDLLTFNEVFGSRSHDGAPTRSQAARFLMQAGFGAKDLAQIDEVACLGFEAWIDQQVALPPSYTQPYITAIKNDFENNLNDPSLDGYCVNGGGFVCGGNFMTSWARSVVNGPDQLRQRVAFALSQILVAAHDNQSTAITDYYDQFLDHSFGNYEDLLNKVTRHPIMGHWLSHLGNQKANPSIGRFPDENYAREIMQLFSIGLWELNLDGTRKLDSEGEPIPTYGNEEITNLARVFTGVHYNASNFGQGYRDDGFFMTSPMKLFASHHDFGSKIVPIGVDANGDSLHHTIPARSATDANALQDVEDVVYQLVRHPNTAPFICRQLIQFLVTSNPSPSFVARVSTVFRDNGSGEVGDLEAVVRAILLDDEARSPMEHLKTDYFGHLREPVIRMMHHARASKIGDHDNLLWWDWGSHRGATLQEPMAAPTVFNYFRPDYRHPGDIAERRLDSPVFGITNTYTAISVPNRLWRQCEVGFQENGYSYNPDYSEDAELADNIPALLDKLSLIYCAGSLSAKSREIITTAISSTGNLEQRARVAHYAVLMSPEGACLK